MGFQPDQEHKSGSITTEWVAFHLVVNQMLYRPGLHAAHPVALKKIKTAIAANEQDLRQKIERFKSQLANKEVKKAFSFRATAKKVTFQAVHFKDLEQNMLEALKHLEDSLHSQEMRVRIERDNGFQVSDVYKLLTRTLELEHLIKVGLMTLEYINCKKDWADATESRERMATINEKCIKIVDKHLSEIQDLVLFMNKKLGAGYGLTAPLNAVVQSLQFELNNLRVRHYQVQGELGHLAQVVNPPKTTQLTESLFSFELILERNQQAQQPSNGLFTRLFRSCTCNGASVREAQRIKNKLGFLLQSNHTQNQVVAHLVHEYRHAQDPAVKQTLGDILWMNKIEPMVLQGTMLEAYQAIYNAEQAKKENLSMKAHLI